MRLTLPNKNSIDGLKKMSEIKEYPKCIEHNSRAIKEEIPAKKGVVDDSIDNVRGYLSAANEALLEAYEHIDYSYPIQIGKEVLTTGENSKLDEEMQNKVSVNSNKAITLVAIVRN